MTKFIRLGLDSGTGGVWVNRDHIVTVRPIIVEGVAESDFALEVEVKATGMHLVRERVFVGSHADAVAAWTTVLAELNEPEVPAP